MRYHNAYKGKRRWATLSYCWSLTLPPSQWEGYPPEFGRPISPSLWAVRATTGGRGFLGDFLDDGVSSFDQPWKQSCQPDKSPVFDTLTASKASAGRAPASCKLSCMASSRACRALASLPPRAQHHAWHRRERAPPPEHYRTAAVLLKVQLYMYCVTHYVQQ